MFEQIKRNRLLTYLAIVLMAALYGIMGYFIGEAVAPGLGLSGVGVALIFSSIQYMVAVAAGNGIILGAAGARRIEKGHSQRLYNVVEEMTIASGLPKMPEIYIIDSNIPNAFAVGSPGKSAVAVTTGLLSMLGRDELQGVVAHEAGHITNHDSKLMVVLGIMLGTIIILSDIFLRGLFYGGSGRLGRRRGRGGQGTAVILLLALVLAILAPFLARILYFFCSRRREYLADASAALFTRYPLGLASALEKISGGIPARTKASKVLAPMYIVNPLQARSFAFFDTHPSTEERVRILKGMMGGASYNDYERSYRHIRESKGGVIHASALTAAGEIPIREPSTAEEPDFTGRRREAVDILHRMEGARFIPCPCSLTFKISPDFPEKTLRCPRCGRILDLNTGEAVDTPPPEPSGGEPLEVRVAPAGWRRFKCSCGKMVELSPSFLGKFMRCPSCRRSIKILTGVED